MSGISFNPNAGAKVSGDSLKLDPEMRQAFENIKFNMADTLKKLKSAESVKIINGADSSSEISNETSITDKDGNLKPDVDLKNVLNADGTLKLGWTVDKNGVPKYSKLLAMIDASPTSDKMPTLPANNQNVLPSVKMPTLPYNNQNVSPSVKMPTLPDNQPQVKYEIKDAKLVQQKF